MPRYRLLPLLRLPHTHYAHAVRLLYPLLYALLHICTHCPHALHSTLQLPRCLFISRLPHIALLLPYLRWFTRIYHSHRIRHVAVYLSTPQHYITHSPHYIATVRRVYVITHSFTYNFTTHIAHYIVIYYVDSGSHALLHLPIQLPAYLHVTYIALYVSVVPDLLLPHTLHTLRYYTTCIYFTVVPTYFACICTFIIYVVTFCLLACRFSNIFTHIVHSHLFTLVCCAILFLRYTFLRYPPHILLLLHILPSFPFYYTVYYLLLFPLFIYLFAILLPPHYTPPHTTLLLVHVYSYNTFLFCCYVVVVLFTTFTLYVHVVYSTRLTPAHVTVTFTLHFVSDHRYC